MVRLSAVPAALAAAGMLVMAPTQAQDATQDLNVTAQVGALCIFDLDAGPAPALDFGIYDPQADTDVDITTTVYITCTTDSSVRLGGNNGQNAGGDDGTPAETGRRMSDGEGNLLSYAVAPWADPAPNLAGAGGNDPNSGWWGAGLANSPTYAIDAGTFEVTLHGRLPTGQDEAPAGVYTDVVVMSLFID